LLRERQVLAVVGPGGVGKTPLSAALALEAAEHRDTLVVTIDPAKRLASALSLELGHEVSHVKPGLDAVMVDTKQALDDLIMEYAPSPEKLHNIFDSPLYQQLSSALVGSEEFAAMGLLHEFHQPGDYDLIIVDTPPSKHAVDFLTVNKRLMRVFESGLTQFLFKPGKLFSMAGGRMAKVLSRWTSREYLDTLSDFLIHFEEMFYEMQGRVEAMEDLLETPSRTGYAVVSAPGVGPAREAIQLSQEVIDLGLNIDVTLANRVYPPVGPGTPDQEAASLLEHYARLAKDHQEGMRQLTETIAPTIAVPALADVVGIQGLERLRPYLTP
ncbi:MAG: ArsA-related P-loop ATPase, partial [Candidatus Thermoplasmatota archaeon]|nr:ArsA-related P-loop ATPase [Candidatus Thermoplasmatota archaeon]